MIHDDIAIKSVRRINVRLIFSGSTCELGAMVDFVRNNYPGTRLIGVGFSLGGNIMVKYLGENSDHQKDFVSAVSLCQGYDVMK